jgi:hypothetical protein
MRGQNHAHLGVEQACQDCRAARRQMCGEVARHQTQWPSENIGKYKIEHRATANGGFLPAVAKANAHVGGEAVQAGVLRCYAHGPGVDIDGEDRAMEQARGGHAKDAAAAAHIENTPWASVRDAFEGAQAAAG